MQGVDCDRVLCYVPERCHGFALAKTNRARQGIENRNTITQQQITRLNAWRAVVVNPQQASAEQAIQLLQQDLSLSRKP